VSIASDLTNFLYLITWRANKIEKFVFVKIKSFSYLKIGFPLTKNTCKKKIEKKHKTYFILFFLQEIEYFM
jgi:hypothetical protein